MNHALFAVGVVTVHLSVNVAHITPGPALESFFSLVVVVLMVDYNVMLLLVCSFCIVVELL